jgi:cell division protein FtsL
MKLAKLLFVVIAGLLIGNVIVANTAVDESVTVKVMSAEIEAMSQANLQLKQEIAATGSLTRIAERAETLGFVSVPKVVTLTTSSLASR